ncbi:MAG: DUF2341 domain-containing protein [Acidobacteriota bacterium]
MGPADVLYWYSGTSHEPESDLFFRHGSFFNPKLNQQMTATNSPASGGSSLQTAQDGIRSITYGDVYKDGATIFSNVDPSTLGGLPAGYAPLNNLAYRIVTDAIVSGPHIVAIDVPSINDQSVFNDLAIFHLEMDPFDPDNMIWVDDTILPPNTPAPDFTNRVVNARVNDVGYFVIGKLVQVQPDPGSSDLSVTLGHSSTSVVVENNLSYTIHVVNGGTQPSSGVGVIDVLPQEAMFVSASASQGTCKYKSGSVYCKPGTLMSGNSADITIVANTVEGKTGIPSQGRSIINTVVVAGGNDDPNLDNNSATDTVLLQPNSNSRPSVSISSPTSGATYAPSASINIIATASDSDGTISKVEIFDGATLIGTPTSGAANQYQLSWTPTSGPHSLVAVATDNGSRTNISDPVSIFVNGNGNISITSPSQNAVFDPSSNITVTANATGSVSRVEFFANSISLGESFGGNPYSVTWNGVAAGNYTLTAVVTDSSGAKTTSAPVSISVSNRPTVTIVSPTDGTSYPMSSKVAIMATAQDSDGFVKKVDFYANSSIVGTGLFLGQDRFTIDWISVPPGIYSLAAVATDDLGATTTSGSITIGVNTPSPSAGEFIWFDDALPPGTLSHTDDEGWYWVDANPGALSGAKAHQSRSFGQIDPPNSLHQHYFEGATTTLPVNAGDKLFTYVFLDGNSMPHEIMLQWKDANGWEHRAYWGANNINWGVDGTNSRRFMGPLPKAGQWVRLEVPSNLVGLEGSTLNGMAFTLDAGRATFDLAGKTTANAAPRPVTPPGDSVWIEDGLPSGSVTATVNDQWNWVTSPHYSGLGAHQSQVSVNHNSIIYRSHSFTGAQAPMQVNPGDVLFTYVYVDPSAPAQQIMLQWYDGTSWEHRAFWSNIYLGSKIPDSGVWGTESQRYMGALPPTGSWYRLEVPASYVGLDGKAVSGMAFSLYGLEPTATWDRSGKAAQITSAPRPLSATAGVFRLFNSTYGYAFETTDLAAQDHAVQTANVFFAYTSQAAGTVPMYRFRRPTNYEYFYSRCKECYVPPSWQFEGIAFYVYPDATTPGTAPLYLYHDSQFHYFLTVNQNEAAGMTLDGTAAYVYATNPVAPVNSAPVISLTNPANGALFTAPATVSINASASDSDGSISKVEFFQGSTKLGEVSTAPYSFDWNNVVSGSYVLTAVATDNLGSGAVSNPVSITVNAPPNVNLNNPGPGTNFPANTPITINASASDSDGTIAKVEFFVNGNKLGEVTNGPYAFTWNNASTGTYSVTATATDNLGATSTSGAVSITVGKSDQSITFDPIPDKTYGDAPFSINATSSSGLPVNFTVISGAATLSANSVTITGAGSVSIRGDQAGNDSFNPAQSVTRSFNVAKAAQTITFNAIAGKTYGDAPFGVSGSSSSGLPVSFAIVSGPATISGNTVTITGVGTVTVRASQAGNTNYNAAADVDRSFIINKGAATITLSNLSQTYNGTPKTATATTNPAGLSAVTITYNGSSTAPTNAGSYSVVASLTNDNYQAANAAGTLTVAMAAQTITFNTLADKTYGNSPFIVSASSSSGLSVSFSIVSGPATISGSTVTITGAGTVTVRASQAGNENYNAAAHVDRSFSVAKATATITLSNLNQTYNASPKPATATTNPAGLSGVSITYNGSSSAPTNAGTYSVVASLTNNDYTAGNATGTLIIGKSTPNVTWNNPADIVYGTALSSTQLNATASFGGSGLAGTFAYTPGPGTVLNAGSNQTLSTTFTPTDIINFNNAPGSAHINVTSVGGWTNGYTYRRSVTIDHAKVPNSDQINFPLLISGTYSYLATVANGGNVQNANGYDIIFTSDSGCTTKLEHEVETYNAANGAVNYWVKVPTLSPTTDTSIYLCYGNANITTDQSNKTGVWDTNFKGVWHLPNGTTLNVADSTNNLNGTNGGATAVGGKVGGGAGFDGSSQYIGVGTMGLTTLSFEAWVNLQSGGAADWNVYGDFGWNSTDGFAAACNNVGGNYYFAKQAVVVMNSGVACSPGVWKHVVWTIATDNKARLYVNGVLVYTDANTSAVITATHNGALGSRRDIAGNPFKFFKGYLDEVRISNVARAADWIATEYANQSSPASFYTISSSSGGTYAYRRSITIDHTKVPNSDQVNFPLLISGTYSYLATVANAGNVQNANGYDIIFTSDSGCATKLDHEIETYNATTGAVNYWVKVPTVSHTSDTLIYVCYGNASITTDQSNSTAVWDSNYKGVWHLPNGSTLSSSDSTANGSHGTNHSATAVAGKINGGAGFDGSSQYIGTPQIVATYTTVEHWVYRTGNASFAIMADAGWNSTDGFVTVVTGTVHAFVKQARAAINSTTSSAINTWEHVVWTVDVDNKARLYVNGVLTYTDTDTQAIINQTHGGSLGSRLDASGNPIKYFPGQLDEVRNTNVPRSAYWIATEYNNQNSPATFYVITAQ